MVSNGDYTRMSRSLPGSTPTQTGCAIRSGLPAGKPALRRGAIAVELLVSVPILVILLLAVIEFGLIFAAIKQVAFASRLGAKLASEAGTTANLTTIVSDGTLRAAIDRQLQAAGATGSCQIIVQYGTGGVPMTLLSAPNSCDCGASALAGPGTGTFVRVEVGALLDEFCPNLLGPFGFSIAGRAISHTTTFALE
jgi:Flp pilus assembly protein TadG